MITNRKTLTEREMTLHLTLKKKWFDMIASGEKKEEYREIKPYWINRLTWHEFHGRIKNESDLENEIWGNLFSIYNEDVIKERYFDHVEFRNGYKRDAPKLIFECKRIMFDEGVEKWGAELNKKYFVIQLGNRV